LVGIFFQPTCRKKKKKWYMKNPSWIRNKSECSTAW
jgi:hypothetical protein